MCASWERGGRGGGKGPEKINLPTAQHSPNRETSYWCILDFMCNLICKKPKPAPAPAPPASAYQQVIDAMEQSNAEMRQQFEVLCTTLRDGCESITEENRRAFQQEMDGMRQTFEHMRAQFQSVIDKAKASKQGALDTSPADADADAAVATL